ncbi:hypothetical protein MKW94_004311, partial [Papaver nudicaule]|nr:hypothetical protein [Papaver nudicaule]
MKEQPVQHQNKHATDAVISRRSPRFLDQQVQCQVECRDEHAVEASRKRKAHSIAPDQKRSRAVFRTPPSSIPANEQELVRRSPRFLQHSESVHPFGSNDHDLEESRKRKGKSIAPYQ